MEEAASLPSTPAGGPLQAITPDRANQQRESVAGGRDSSVHDKISQFNNMSVSLQSKQLERKTADAALKRAMLGREEAETELTKYKEEVKALRQAVEEGKERERRVGERLETVMESYGRAKETHAHTQALWEKEIRRARKETFKTQSSTVKLQEELKSARGASKLAEENLEREKERSKVREQEAFAARYQIVGVQEQLEQALEKIKLVEQERDAFKTAAHNEEVARIAAEGRIPLPAAEDPADEFASPKKLNKKKKGPLKVPARDVRVSLSTMEIVSSAASEMEIEELTLQVQWERQRAERAQEMIEFLQAECQMHCCPCSKSKSRASRSLTYHDAVEEAASVMTYVEEPQPVHPAEEDPKDEKHEPEDMVDVVPQVEELPVMVSRPKSKKESRRSTIFCPKEGIFRTISEQDAAAMEIEEEVEAIVHSVHEMDLDQRTYGQPVEETPEEEEDDPRMYARTPSVEPPAFAILAQERTSLLSLLNAPHEAHTAPLPTIPSIPAISDEDGSEQGPESESPEPQELPRARSHNSNASYTVTTTVPIRDESEQLNSSLAEKLRTPSGASNASFDSKDPALTPTMTREEALAKIRERRGRARSANQGTTTTTSATTVQKKMADGKVRRDASASAIRARKSRS